MEGSPADQELMSRAAQGESSARAQLVERFRSAVRRFLRRLAHDEALAEDLTQETFLVALEHVRAWKGTGTVKGWLFSIARSRYLMHQRAPHTRQQPAEDASLERLGMEAGWGAPMDPEALAARLQERVALEKALQSLEPEFREVLTLRDLEGLSGEETAEVLGLGLPAMKSRLHRARLALVASVKRGAAAHG